MVKTNTLDHFNHIPSIKTNAEAFVHTSQESVDVGHDDKVVNDFSMQISTLGPTEATYQLQSDELPTTDFLLQVETPTVSTIAIPIDADQCHNYVADAIKPTVDPVDTQLEPDQCHNHVIYTTSAIHSVMKEILDSSAIVTLNTVAINSTSSVAILKEMDTVESVHKLDITDVSMHALWGHDVTDIDIPKVPPDRYKPCPEKISAVYYRGLQHLGEKPPWSLNRVSL